MKFKKTLALLLACLSLTSAACATSGNAAHQDMQKRWKALSSDEKSQVYEIMEKRAQTEFELLEKYAQLGLIDEKKADEVRSHIEKRLDEIKKEQLFPGAGKGPREEGRKKTV